MIPSAGGSGTSSRRLLKPSRRLPHTSGIGAGEVPGGRGSSGGSSRRGKGGALRLLLRWTFGGLLAAAMLLMAPSFGHAAGDNALCHFARILAVGRRAEDILARVGGEEFAIVLPGTGLEAALKMADSLCVLIETSPIKVNGNTLPMTASFGVATLSNSDTCLGDVILRADRALYRSKRSGRNRVDLESSQLMLALDGTLRPISG